MFLKPVEKEIPILSEDQILKLINNAKRNGEIMVDIWGKKISKKTVKNLRKKGLVVKNKPAICDSLKWHLRISW